MSKPKITSSASLFASSLVASSVIASEGAADDVLVSGKISPDDDPVLMARMLDTDTRLAPWGLDAEDLDALTPPMVKAELHYTIFAGPGDDMVRVPGTVLREVKSPRGRTFTIQVNTQTREVFTPTGEKLDPPQWLVKQLRNGG